MKRSFLLMVLGATVLSTGFAHAQVSYTNNTPSAPVVPTGVVPAYSNAPAPAPAPITEPGPVAVRQILPHSTTASSSGLPSGTKTIPASYYGADIPFSIAVSSIVPSDYSVAYDTSVDKDSIVSWAGGRPWGETLSTLTAAHGYDVHVSGKNISIAKAFDGGSASTAPASGNVAPTSGNIASSIAMADSHAVSGAGGAIDGGAIAVPTAEVPQGYHALKRSQSSTSTVDAAPMPSIEGVPQKRVTSVVMRSNGPGDGDALVANSPSSRVSGVPLVPYAPKNGGYGVYYAAPHTGLAQVLSVWANANGWQLQYDAHSNYEIDMPVTLKGDFKEAVKTLVKSFVVTVPPREKFYNGNNVLRIFNYSDNEPI